ncbi:hypothetical protein BRSU_2488 [Brachyspira suanatina]|uniref:KAP NTPase domain-containing protein n=1 Tax=Brachyspira suanatina TaxID=381802 RepID=A0A0G4KA76_9SPIR|nr:hypothetical protein BRSU_2488 [Brachyspira suanatina]
MSIFPSKLTKILFPFLYGSSDNYSEYEEGKDLTPYQFKLFVEKFYSLYSNFFDKDIIIVIDNMDRLSKDEEEKFISSLYTFIECMQKKDCNINTWFILAVDKKSIGKNNSSVDTSFYDKLSPYEVSIPEMNNDMVNNFFLKLLSNELEYYDDIKRVRGIDNIILLLNFSKNNILDSSQYITSYYYTPRLIKKFVNQIKINYYSYINLTEDKQILTKYSFFVASLFVSSVQIFNNEDMLLKLISNREKFKRIVNSINRYGT